MSDKDKKRATYIALFIAGLVIIWLLLRHNATFQQLVKQNVPWAVPLMGDNVAPENYNINSPGYTPANFPSVTKGKCDSNSPCVFCTIPNATFPSKPQTITQAPQYVTANYQVPKTFTAPVNIQPRFWLSN